MSSQRLSASICLFLFFIFPHVFSWWAGWFVQLISSMATSVSLSCTSLTRLPKELLVAGLHGQICFLGLLRTNPSVDPLLVLPMRLPYDSKWVQKRDCNRSRASSASSLIWADSVPSCGSETGSCVAQLILCSSRPDRGSSWLFDWRRLTWFVARP